MIRRFCLPILAHIAALPLTLAGRLFNAFTDPADPHRRADAALLLFALVMLGCWACGVFKE